MIISFSKNLRYFVYRHAADMRKGFDGLCGLVFNEFLMTPLGGDVFIFFNQRRDRIKILHWQGDGFAIYHKRLERGTFEIPFNDASQKSIEIDASTIQLILEGITLSSVKKRKRFMNV